MDPTKKQEAALKAAIAEAKRKSGKTGSLRKDTLKKLIDQTHSDNVSLKIIAAANICYFLADSPELEEEGINAVYDLCEDQDPEVRIAGYNAITAVSREQTKWVKRNADVLVQLLQSDEPKEVDVVKDALLSHLDLDPRVTLGVLCDQVIPPDEPLDQDEKSLRDSLRILVLSFLAEEAKPLISKLLGAGTETAKEAEKVLIGGLKAALPKLSVNEHQVIVKDLLLPLPSFQRPSQQGDELLREILKRTAETLKTAIPPNGKANLEITRIYLELASLLVIKQKTASVSELLKFYYSNLAGKMTLQKLSADDQIWTIARMAETLAAEKELSAEVRSPFMAQAINATPMLIDQLITNGKLDPSSWDAAKDFLETLRWWRHETRSAVPAHLRTSLENLQKAMDTGKTETGAGKPQIRVMQDLIRSLLEAPTTTRKSQNTLKASKTSLRNALSEPDISANVANDSFSRLPPSRSEGGIAISRNSSTTTVIMAAHPKRISQADDDTPKTKRQKVNATVGGAPSLLSRLGTSLNGRSTLPQTPAISQDLNTAHIITQPSHGINIKGAAAQEARAVTLIDRLHGPFNPGSSDGGGANSRARGAIRQ